MFCFSPSWVFIYEKGYQIEDTAIGSVLTKMKGVGYTTVAGQERVWDVADYVFPEQVCVWVCYNVFQNYSHFPFILLQPCTVISMYFLILNVQPLSNQWVELK